MFVAQPGLIVGNRYSLTHVIGRGGMGEVWKAHDRELDSACAVKFILQHLASDRGIRERFAREAKAVARLRSPHVVHILGVGEIENIPYLAMELLDGETLLARLERVGRLHPAVTLTVVEQVAEALENAHQAGVVHRDLKPDNIWFWSGNKVFVKVLDFGVAKTGLTTESLQTATGALVGTPQYMSPEQALGNRDIDHRSDLWSLAVITVECLSGRRPFDSTGLGDLLMKIVGGTPPPLGDLLADMPPGLDVWWQRALARDPRDRYQSAAELVEALRVHLSAFDKDWVPDVDSARPVRTLAVEDIVSVAPVSIAPQASSPWSGAPRRGLASPSTAPLHGGTPAQVVSASQSASLPIAARTEAVRREFAATPQPRSNLPSGASPYSAPAPHALRPGELLGEAARTGTVRFGAGLRETGQSEPAPSQAASVPGPEALPAEGAARRSPGSVGPISSSRLSPQLLGNRRLTLIAAGALGGAAVLITVVRLFVADPPEPPGTPPSAPTVAASQHAQPAAAQPPPPVPPAEPKPVPPPAAQGGGTLPGTANQPESTTSALRPAPQPEAPAPAPEAADTAPIAEPPATPPASNDPAPPPRPAVIITPPPPVVPKKVGSLPPAPAKRPEPAAAKPAPGPGATDGAADAEAAKQRRLKSLGLSNAK